MYDSAEIFGALKACGGKVYLAAERLGCSPNTIKNHMAKVPEMAQYVEDMRDKLVDVAELKFQQAIQNGEHWAIAMALKTLGKGRGYVERQEISAAADVKLYDVDHTPEDLYPGDEG